jgi:hypothetical protein
MELTADQVDRLERLSSAWADAEKAIKIADQVVGDVIIPAIKELRYAGRKQAKCMHNYLTSTNLVEADRWLEDAINDCHRARHDATDAATAYIARRLEHVIDELGTEAVREHFAEYSDLRGMLSAIRSKVANARHDHNGRNDIYAVIELDELPKIMELYEKLLANEPYMQDKRLNSWMLKQGINFGWLVASVIAILALWRAW